MTSRVRIRLGQLEVEYEGDEQFLKDELPTLVDSISRLYREAHEVIPQEDAPVQASVGSPVFSSPTEVGTTNNITAKLSVDSGPDLILAAATRLTLGAGQASFSRQSLLEEMKTATRYFNKNYTNNLSKYLAGLVKFGKLKEVAKDTYALSAAALQEIEAQIAA